jgi:hypothetical protein
MAAALFPHHRQLDPARIPGLDWLLALLGAVLACLLWPGALD